MRVLVIFKENPQKYRFIFQCKAVNFIQNISELILSLCEIDDA